MNKIVLPKNAQAGLKIFCKTCRVDNPKCRHYTNQVYRARIHVKGSKNGVKTKYLEARTYEEAVIELLEYKKYLINNNYNTSSNFEESPNDFNIIGAILKYRQYMRGESEYAHLRKTVSKAHIDETIRYCKSFALELKKTKNLQTTRVTDIQKIDISNFYKTIESKYSEKTINKCIGALKSFYEFLIEVEEIEMKNPFRSVITKSVIPPTIDIITQDEFNDILKSIDTADPFCKLDGKLGKQIRFKPYLKDGIKLFLFTGGRREEVVNLKWSDIYQTENGIYFFSIDNLKVKRIKKSNKEFKKYFPINEDFKQFLIELGWNEKIGKDEYIIYPERTCGSSTLMDVLSKGFTHYRKAAGIEKNISLSNLRKTYITWTNQVLGNETGYITSHSTNKVLKDYYLDPKVLNAIEKAALEVRVFGSK